jgi:hypothetical protein
MRNFSGRLRSYVGGRRHQVMRIEITDAVRKALGH